MGDAPGIPADWTETEQWVWERISAGEPADLNVRDGNQKNPDPCNEEGWTQERRLSVKFLQTILTQKAFVDCTPNEGVRIIGALVDDAPLTLGYARLRHFFSLKKSRIVGDVKCRNLRVDSELWLLECFVEGAVILSGADIQTLINLRRSVFTGGVDLESAKVGINLLMRNATFQSKVNLRFAKIGSSLEMDGATFKGDVNLNGITVGGTVVIRNGASFLGAVNLGLAKIGRNLEIEDATFKEDVNLNGITVGVTTFISRDASFRGKVDLESANIGCNLMVSDAIFRSDFILRSAKIGVCLQIEDAIFERSVNLNRATVAMSVIFNVCTIFQGKVNMGSAKIGSCLIVNGTTFKRNFNLNRATVGESAFLQKGTTFHDEVNMGSARIGSDLAIDGVTIHGKVDLTGATIMGTAHILNKAKFKDEVNLTSAMIGSSLEVQATTFKRNFILNGATVAGGVFLWKGTTFEGEVNLGLTKIGSSFCTHGATFKGNVILYSVTVGQDVFLSNGATFHGEVDLRLAKIGSTLEMSLATFNKVANLTGCKVTGDFLISASEVASPRWQEGASLILRNAHVGALQDWWQSESENAWPEKYWLEGFTYDRLGAISKGNETDMLDRSVTSYIQWLDKDLSSSAQPYEQLACRFREAGEPYKATDILYAVKERRRREAWSTVDGFGKEKKREWLRAIGLSMLCWTIGYGIGNRYFRSLAWVLSLTCLGTIVLILFGSYFSTNWGHLFFASLDQLLPIITLDKAHDALIFGDTSAIPYVAPQPDGVLFYFYVHKILGWVLGSFLIAGLAGLTQRD